jgi:hypothetical protein
MSPSLRDEDGQYSFREHYFLIVPHYHERNVASGSHDLGVILTLAPFLGLKTGFRSKVLYGATSPPLDRESQQTRPHGEAQDARVATIRDNLPTAQGEAVCGLASQLALLFRRKSKLYFSRRNTDD